MKWEQLARFIHTTQHLKLKQIFFRLYYISKQISRSHLSSAGRGIRRVAAGGGFPHPLLCATFSCWREKGCLSDTGTFLFHGETGRLDDVTIWNSTHHSKLWLYNIHYFDDLMCVNADARRDLLNRYIAIWLDNNPAYTGNGWEPYPLSLRLVNWVKWFSTQKVEPQWLASLAIQADALTQQIEHHILGNHIFANGKALVFVGAYLSSQPAERWLKKGLKILDHEINEQFFADGGHFERSPMYHAILLWDMCDLVHLAEQSHQPLLLSRKAQWQAVIERGLRWLSCMTHPDGDISFFNDAAFGIAPRLADLLLYAEQLGVYLLKESNELTSLSLLNASGYCAVNLKDNGKAILDVANVGPDYQPGHAHADTLSFELSLYGQRVIVNSGTSQYGEGELRQFQRSTTAHNTVCIDGANSSDVWAGFRVARRAYPRDLSVGSDFIGCAHDGYLRLPGRVTHHRKWVFSEKSMIAYDEMTGRWSDAEARFYLHPDIRVVDSQNDRVVCCLPEGQHIVFQFDGALTIRIEPSHWYPAFGLSVENRCLVVSIEENNLATHINWSI